MRIPTNKGTHGVENLISFSPVLEWPLVLEMFGGFLTYVTSELGKLTDTASIHAHPDKIDNSLQLDKLFNAPKSNGSKFV